jgi:two-component system C4-dicarboxylate transport sensor histidine kinase DctB
MQSIARRFRSWTSTLDPVASYASTSPRAWLGMIPVVLLFVAIGAWVPVTSDFLQLRAIPALLCFAPIPLLVPVLARYGAKDGALTSTGWVLFVVGTHFVQFFAAGLVAFSGPNGAAVYAAIFLFVVAFHSLSERVTFEYPFMGFGTALVCLVAGALNPTPEKIAMFAVLTPISVGIAFSAGYYGKALADGREKVERMRLALNAQMLEQKQHEVSALNEKIVELLGVNHDIKNVLTGARLNALAVAEVVAGKGPPMPPEELAEVAAEVLNALELVSAVVLQARALVPQAPRPAAGEESGIVPVALEPVLTAARRQLSTRFPDREIRVDAEPGIVNVRGGEPALRRILDNLLVNACQGDGRVGAARIEVAAKAEENRVLLSVVDDGPGFPPELLNGRAEGFFTTKAAGTGLGLYTCEALVRASGGELSRANVPGGGARVDVTLPLAPAAPASRVAAA